MWERTIEHDIAVCTYGTPAPAPILLETPAPSSLSLVLKWACSLLPAHIARRIPAPCFHMPEESWSLLPAPFLSGIMIPATCFHFSEEFFFAYIPQRNCAPCSLLLFTSVIPYSPERFCSLFLCFHYQEEWFSLILFHRWILFPVPLLPFPRGVLLPAPCFHSPEKSLLSPFTPQRKSPPIPRWILLLLPASIAQSNSISRFSAHIPKKNSAPYSMLPFLSKTLLSIFVMSFFFLRYNIPYSGCFTCKAFVQINCDYCVYFVWLLLLLNNCALLSAWEMSLDRKSVSVINSCLTELMTVLGPGEILELSVFRPLAVLAVPETRKYNQALSHCAALQFKTNLDTELFKKKGFQINIH